MDEVDRLVQEAWAHPMRPARGGAVPALRLSIVTCMDARVDPAALFGLRPGGAHVIRNAGGVVTPDVLDSVAISQALFGTRHSGVLAPTPLLQRSLPAGPLAGERPAAGARPSEGWRCDPTPGC